MRIVTRGKNIQLTDALKKHVDKRIGKVDKYFDDNPELQVTLSVVKDTHVVEAMLSHEGLLIRAEVESSDMYASVDMVVEKLERQIRKYKTRINRKARQVPVANGSSGVEQDDEPQIVRTKRFAIKPMLADEAVLQMNLLGHDFFMFTNAETSQANVVYRRKDGNFGLIEPEV